MPGSAKQKASYGIGKLHGPKSCSSSWSSWNLCRIFQSRERVGPSAVPPLGKPNPVSKIELAFCKCDFDNDGSAFAVVKITWWRARIFKLINRAIAICDMRQMKISVLDKRHDIKAPGKILIEALFYFPEPQNYDYYLMTNFEMVYCVAQLTYQWTTRPEFSGVSTPNPIPTNWGLFF